MSRDVTHHHNRERGLSSCHHTSETASLREEDQGIESHRESECIHFMFVYQNQYNLAFFETSNFISRAGVGFVLLMC